MQINPLSTSVIGREKYLKYSNHSCPVFQAGKISKVPDVSGQILDTKLLSKLEGLFKLKPPEAPKGLKLKVSPTTGCILSLSKILDNNSKLEVVKNFKVDKTGKFIYITFKEFHGNKLKNAIGIDCKSKELIRLYKDGKLMSVDGNVVKIPVGTKQYTDNIKSLSKYLNIILKKNETAKSSEVEILKQSLTVREEQPKKITVMEKIDESTEMSDNEFEEMIRSDIEFGEKYQHELKRKITGQSSEDEFDEFMRKTFCPQPVFIHENEPKTVTNDSAISSNDVVETAKNIISEKVKKAKPVQTERNTVSEVKQAENKKSSDIQIHPIPNNIPQIEKRIWRIENAPFGILSKPTQNFVANINKTFLKLMELRSARRSNGKKIVELKENYEKIIYKGRTQKNVLFKYKNGETVSVLYTKSLPNQTRIVHTDKKGNSKHFLIIDGEKVVSNLYKNNPWLMPEKFRFMTNREIGETGIENLIMFVERELGKYYEYMYENLGNPALVRRRNKNSATDAIKTKLKEAEDTFSDSIKRLSSFINTHPKADAAKLVKEYFSVMSENLKNCSLDNIKDLKFGIKDFWEKQTKQ